MFRSIQVFIFIFLIHIPVIQEPAGKRLNSAAFNLQNSKVGSSYRKACRPENIKKIAIRMSPDFNFFPGTKSTFDIDVFYEYKNKQYVQSTDATSPKKKININDYVIDVKGGVFASPNFIVIHQDLAGLENGALVIDVKHKRNDSIHTQWRTVIDFSAPLNIRATGENGEENGRLLWSGRDASEPTSDGCKKEAKDGRSGNDGGRGENGHSLRVYIKKVYVRPLQKHLLAIRIEDITTKQESFYLRDASAPLNFDVSGGNGGNGTKGKDGGNGLIELVNGNAICCGAGDGGNGGNGGSGGDGGQVVLVLDPSVVREELKCTLFATGGYGGSGAAAGEGGRISNVANDGNACTHLQPGKNGRPGDHGAMGTTTTAFIYENALVTHPKFTALEH